MELTLEQKLDEVLKLLKPKEAKVIELPSKKSKAQIERDAIDFYKMKIRNHYAKTK